tara:strand:+ start:97 stop:561 length:465 start_codon:yes stop_codon:yes gene_type:complete
MRYALGLVLVALLFFFFILFWPTKENNINRSKEQNFSSEISEDEILLSEAINKNDEDRYEAMKSEYKTIEKERRVLKQRLARLKHNMWGLKFKKNTAKEMSEVLLNAHKLIKNPGLLGSFSDIESIRDEIMKLRFANKALDGVSDIINQKRNDD